MRSARVALVSLVAATLSTAAFPLLLDLRSQGTKMFEPQSFDFVLLFASVFAIALGLQLASFTSARYITLVALLASGSLLMAFLAAFSIGAAFLPVGIVSLLLLYRALRRVRVDGLIRRAAFGGAAVGFGLPLLYVALTVPPTVECFPNGGGTSSGRWRDPSSQVISSRGGMTVSRDGVVTGTMTYTDSVVTFRCEGGRLVEFIRTPG